MGIHNFCKLLDCILPPSTEIRRPFDTILFDVQSLLYTSIYYAFESEEKSFYREVCLSTWDQIRKTLSGLLDQMEGERHVVLAFDGIGVPMKWPTQRQRRAGRDTLKGKSLYQSSLFGVNVLSLRVKKFLVKRLKQMALDHELTLIISGCNVPGEGEHKLFHLAEAWNCKNPLVVSIDQDVFVIALMRRHRYDSIQIFRYNKVYDLSRLPEDYPWEAFIVVSFLFGNDFAPCLVSISETNGPVILNAVKEDSDPPLIVCRFLDRIEKNIRFERVSYVDRSLLVQFWMCHLWLSHYYTLTEFPQKHMENFYYDRFDRNQVLTGLCSLDFSRDAYDEALKTYTRLETRACPDHVSAVFLDTDVKDQLQRFFVKGSDNACEVIRATRRRREEPSTGTSSDGTSATVSERI